MPAAPAPSDRAHRSRPVSRLVGPIGVLAAVVAVVATMLGTGGEGPEALPDLTPRALVAALRSSIATGFSGTVVSHFSLGVPNGFAAGESRDGSALPALLDGSHTLQVWYGGVERQRVAVLGATDETDLFRDGRDLWQWSSGRRVAVHRSLPETYLPDAAGPGAADATSLTPRGLAGTALAALDARTAVGIARETVVADRPAYELVLTPDEADTRIGSVHITVDGATKIPLAVQVYGRGAARAAIDVGFTSVRLAAPAAAYFHFSPPSDAIVREAPPAPAPALRVIGSGWSSVLTAAGVDPSDLGPGLAQVMTPVAGSWGRGRVLHTDLVSVLLTDDRRMFVGAVEPRVLYSAAASEK